MKLDDKKLEEELKSKCWCRRKRAQYRKEGKKPPYIHCHGYMDTPEICFVGSFGLKNEA